MSTSKFKVGDMVRVPSWRAGNTTCFKWGQVVTVEDIDEDYPGQLRVAGRTGLSKYTAVQWLSGRNCRLAKNAMRKRAAALHSQSV